MKISMTVNEKQWESISNEIHGNTRPVLPGEVINIGNNVNIELESLTQHRALDVPSVLNFVVDTAVTMEVGLITTWLYDKCKASGVDEIEIESKKTRVSFKEIETALGEELRKLDK